MISAKGTWNPILPELSLQMKTQLGQYPDYNLERPQAEDLVKLFPDSRPTEILRWQMGVRLNGYVCGYVSYAAVDYEYTIHSHSFTNTLSLGQTPQTQP